MHLGRRAHLGVLVAFTFVLQQASAQDDLTDKELDALLADEGALEEWLESEFTGWDFTSFLRAGWGYSDNVLLATVNPQEGQYLRSDLELFLMRYPDDKGEFFSYLTGTDIRYSGVEDADKEQLWLFDTEWTRYLGDKVNATFIGQYIYFDQILDLSLTERQETRQRIKYSGYGLGTELEYDAGSQNILTLKLMGNREDFREVLGKNWKGVFDLAWRRPIWPHSDLEFSLNKDIRDYDDRVQRDQFGRPVEGTILKSDRDAAALKYIQQWGKKQQIETILKLQYLENRDNGSGYYDYDQWSLGLSFDGQWQGFEATLDVGFDQSEFLIQKAERFGTELRKKDDAVAELFLKKDLSRRFSVYLLLEYEESRSNVDEDEYDAYSGSLGFQIDLWGNP